MPHAWLKDGTAIQDNIPDGFVLLMLKDGEYQGSDLKEAFSRLGAPFSIVNRNDEAARDMYGFDQILLRPDLHIVWRGNESHCDPDHLAEVVTGNRLMTEETR